jgi:hypothetical protein
MALQKLFPARYLFDFIFLFFHLYPPILIVTYFVHGHLWHDHGLSSSHGACEGAYDPFAAQRVSAAVHYLKRYGSCDAGAVYPPAERRVL